MEERERIIRLWFHMWLKQQDLGIDHIFTEDVLYTESWGPQYAGLEKLKHWFYEWNTRGRVQAWEIQQFFHAKDQTVVEWYFKNRMEDGRVEEFDGLSLIRWAPDNRIQALKEFGCNIHHYDPYQQGEPPRLSPEAPKWF